MASGFPVLAQETNIKKLIFAVYNVSLHKISELILKFHMTSVSLEIIWTSIQPLTMTSLYAKRFFRIFLITISSQNHMKVPIPKSKSLLPQLSFLVVISCYTNQQHLSIKNVYNRIHFIMFLLRNLLIDWSEGGRMNDITSFSEVIIKKMLKF